MDCDYRDPDDFLVDYIIDASHDKRIQEKFYDSAEDLSLAKAIEIGQQLELSQKQMRIVREEKMLISALRSGNE